MIWTNHMVFQSTVSSRITGLWKFTSLAIRDLNLRERNLFIIHFAYRQTSPISIFRLFGNFSWNVCYRLSGVHT